MDLREVLYQVVFQPVYAGGLEIEDGVLRIVHATPKKNEITLVHEHQLPVGVVVGGEILNERDFAAELAEALRASGIRNTYYVTHAPPRQTALRLLQFPPMPPRELRDAVRYEAARNLPYTLAEAAIGYATLSDVVTPKRQSKARATPKRPAFALRRGGKAAKEPEAAAADAGAPADGLEAGSAVPEGATDEVVQGAGKKARKPSDLLVAATPNANVLTLMRVAKQAGVRLGVVEPKPLATLRALRHYGALRRDDLVLDVGAVHSTINVITGGSLKVSRILNYGRDALGASGDEDLIEGVFRDVSTTLEYLTRIDDRIVLRRLLVAGGRLDAGFERVLNDLGLSVEAFAPAEGVPVEATNAIGLALRGAGGI